MAVHLTSFLFSSDMGSYTTHIDKNANAKIDIFLIICYYKRIIRVQFSVNINKILSTIGFYLKNREYYNP